MTDQPNSTMPQPNTDASNTTQDSYVDNYQPPQAPVAAPTTVPAPSTDAQAQAVAPVTAPLDTATIEAPAAPAAPIAPAAPAEPPQAMDAPPVADMSSVPSPAPTEAAAEPQVSPVSQALEDQNVFNLLGVEDAPEEEKESFLDELQQVIWEDFLDNDVQLLITEDEMTGLQQIMDRPDLEELQKQEEIVVYLEKLIPDLEEVMLEKALELKADMMRERISGMKEYYADQPEVVSKIDQANALVEQEKWREAAELLNSIT